MSRGDAASGGAGGAPSANVHVFVYDAAVGAGIAHEKVRDDVVQGTMFDVAGVGRALMLAGNSSVPGVVLRIAPEALSELDARARVREGLFRRVGVRVTDTPCWTWVAGPALAPRLGAARRARGNGGEG